MLHIAATSGTTDIVATPHASTYFPYDTDRIQRAFQSLVDAAPKGITVHLGCDFHLNFDNLQDALENPTKFTVNRHQYLMVELPDLIAFTSIHEALKKLLDRGMVPVITHPERNLSLQPRLREAEAWVRDGCLLQVTGQSLSGRFGSASRRAAHSLLASNLVHFIASDAHDTADRTPDLSPAYQYLTSRYGQSRATDLLVNNPAAVLSGEPLPPSRPLGTRSKLSKLLSLFR